jgi:hypothetical protein
VLVGPAILGTYENIVVVREEEDLVGIKVRQIYKCGPY